ncbi:tetraprenyl-beta-curcumene synthase family protein [Virgibacillus sp. FSP13]
MGKHVPHTAVTLMTAVYRKIFPAVKQELVYWKKRAEQIPNKELRTQALASIASKRFHCQGGAVYALLAGDKWEQAIRFIVAYQTISDYLDNLCDRSTSMDPADFRLLHQSMIDALTPENSVKNYYELRGDQEDGEYLADLVRTCQQIVDQLDDYTMIQDKVLGLEQLYGDLQVHKHVAYDERIPRLVTWYKTNNLEFLSWYEFAAAAGSTLGIFCLVSYTLGGRITSKLTDQIYSSYFPNMQALHILLDYYIDQLEDEWEGDLNFCSYYPTRGKMIERFVYFIEQTEKHVQSLVDCEFHQLVHRGLVGLYLADPKVKKLDGGKEMTNVLLQASGRKAKFFHWNTKMYHRLFG